MRSYDKLAAETRLSVQSVRTAINHLKSTGEVTYQSTSQYGLVTVNNYCKLQDWHRKRQTKGRPAADHKANGFSEKREKAKKANGFFTNPEKPKITERFLINRPPQWDAWIEIIKEVKKWL